MLATLPGVQSLGQVTDVGGQAGVAVARSQAVSGCGTELQLGPGDFGPAFPSCVVQERLVINPETGLPLAQESRYLKLPAGRTWSAPDGLFSYRLFEAAYWTNSTPPPDHR
jgi:hypothetical protein